jgi:NadR type nicotinamide-nucleotide adenylyltransferase
MYDTGVIVGKFYPYHLGHQYLISEGYRQCKELYVYVCHQDWHAIPAEIRAQWIREDYPNAHVGIIDQDVIGLADNDSPGWARLTRELLGDSPDAVFTSEDYGNSWAHHLQCEHVLVDRERARLPISGTQIREDPLANLAWLPPAARAYFALRVAVIGAESTGKTTLCEDLAQALGTRYVPEFGRHYAQAQPDPDLYPWTVDDLRVIARQQERLENWWAAHAGPVLLVDTTPSVTQAFCVAYLGYEDSEIAEVVARERYNLIIMPDPETPYDHEPGRRGENRGLMHERYQRYLQDKPHVIVSGSREERVEQALTALRPLKAKWAAALAKSPSPA